MSGVRMEQVLDAVTGSDLTTAERSFLLAVARSDGPGGAWPSIPTIAERVGVTRRQAQRLRSSLESKGWIVVRQQEGGSEWQRDDRRPNRYELNLERGDISVTPSPNGATSATPRGDIHDITGRHLRHHGATPTSPEQEPEQEHQPVPEQERSPIGEREPRPLLRHAAFFAMSDEREDVSPVIEVVTGIERQEGIGS